MLSWAGYLRVCSLQKEMFSKVCNYYFSRCAMRYSDQAWYYPATLYAAVSASFTIEQEGLPKLANPAEGAESWNDDSPKRRLEELRARLHVREQ